MGGKRCKILPARAHIRKGEHFNFRHIPPWQQFDHSIRYTHDVWQLIGRSNSRLVPPIGDEMKSKWSAALDYPAEAVESVQSVFVQRGRC